VAELVSREMQAVAELKVPLQAEAKYGKSWYDAK
jgi:DNA polymerase I-like protein with 3'-5' exonuclease and polymerase domains